MANNIIEIYPIASEYIVEHGVSEIDSPELFKTVIKQIIGAIPDTVSIEDIKFFFNAAVESMERI